MVRPFVSNFIECPLLPPFPPFSQSLALLLTHASLAYRDRVLSCTYRFRFFFKSSQYKKGAKGDTENENASDIGTIDKRT